MSRPQQGAPRLLIATRANTIGDTLLLTPAITYLATVLPGAVQALLGGGVTSQVVDGNPHVQDAWVREGEARGVSSLVALGWRMRADRIDGVMIMSRSSWRALTPAFVAGVPVRASYRGNARDLLLTHGVPGAGHQNVIERHMDLATAVADAFGATDAVARARAVSRRPELWVRPVELDASRRRLALCGIDFAKPLIGVNAGARDRPSEREWAPERFAAVAGAIADALGGSVLLLGSAAQREVGDRVASLVRCPVVNLCGATTLREAFAAASLCRLWLGNDGGLLHVAAAVCRAVVGVCDPYTARLWGYDTPTCRTLYDRTHARAAAGLVPPSSQWLRDSLDAVSSEEVTAAAFDVLAASRGDVRSKAAAPEQTADVHATS